MINIRDLCKRIGVKDYNSFTRRIRQSGLLESVDYLVIREGRKTHYYLTHTESALYWLSKSNKVKQFRGINHVNVTNSIQLRSQSSNVVYDGELVNSSEVSISVTEQLRISDVSGSTHGSEVPELDGVCISLLNSIGCTAQAILDVRAEREANRKYWRAHELQRRAEIEQRRAENEQRRAEAEQRQAENEQRRVEDEQRPAEVERKRADYAERYARIQRVITKRAS